MQELIKDLQNTAILYCEDKQKMQCSIYLKRGFKDIIKTRDLKIKYWTEEEVIEKAYDQLENIYNATQTKNIELIRKELTRLFNIFTLACWILTTMQKI